MILSKPPAWLFIVPMISLLLACGGGGSGGSSTPTTTAPTPGSVSITNESGTTIFHIYMVPSTSTYGWGTDYLGATGIVLNGASFTITDVTPDNYDLKVVNNAGTVTYKYGIAVAAGENTALVYYTGTTSSASVPNASSSGVNAASASADGTEPAKVKSDDPSENKSSAPYTVPKLTPGAPAQVRERGEDSPFIVKY